MKIRNLTTWLVIETIDNRVRDVSTELAAAGMRMEQLQCTDIRYLVPCSELTPSITGFISNSHFPVHVLLHPDLRYCQPGAIRQLISDITASADPSLFIFPDTICGTPAAAYAAAACAASFIPRVISIDVQNGVFLFRSRDDVHRITRIVSPSVETTLITIPAGAFPKGEEEPVRCTSEPVVQNVEGSYPWRPVLMRRSTGGADLKEARIIIAAGRGIGNVEGLQPVRDLAEVLPGSAIAGSRPVCDAGWLPLSSQVGMTGQTVKPELYIACGISGSTQHLAGMMDSGCIVAVNTDSDAPFFSVADYCIVEDLAEFLPALVDALKTLMPGKENNDN